ncbi:MAG: SCO family protein [Phycisphaerales bacterium]|nr:SCO family protein [Phycisphaerales bacterium]
MIPTTRRNPVSTLLAVLATVIAMSAFPAAAQRLLEKDEIRQLNGVDLLESQGSTLPMDAVFTTADGRDVALAQYFLDDKPTILALVYYECPIVCPTVLTSLVTTLNDLDYTAGEDFRVLVISFDHTENTTQALAKRENFIRNYERSTTNPSVRDGIEFFTGSEESIRSIANSVGFAFNEIAGGEYAHPISLMAVSPKGVLTRYMYGYDYPTKDMKLTLLDASEGKIAASLGDRLLHFCYRYDPLAGSYSLVAFRVMQIGAGLGAIILATVIGLLFYGERKRAHALNQINTDDDDQNGASNTDTSNPSTSTGSIAGVSTGHMS